MSSRLRHQWRTLAAIDMDRHAVATYKANVDCADVRHGSVADHLGNLPPADVVVGGPPCQPFSYAGNRRGNGDARDGVPEFISSVRLVRPRQFLMEQVPGFATFAQGRYQAEAVGALAELGYMVAVRTLDAVAYGVPQFRRRVWHWGIRADLARDGCKHCWPEPTHQWPWPQTPGMSGSLLPAVTVGQALGTTHLERAEARRVYSYSAAMLAKHPPAAPGRPSPAVMAKWAKGGAEGLLGDDVYVRSDGSCIRRLTPDECARLQSVPDDFKWPDSVPKTARYRIIGNGWACLMAMRLGEALAAADPESRTAVDLFCGGGLGAVGWHGRAWQFDGAER